jgi:hypothetical protein
MNNPIKQIMLAAIFIVFVLIFSECSSSKYGEKVIPIKKFVHWEVDFKDDVSTKERDRVLLLIDKYIVDYLYEHKSPAAKVFDINILHIPGTNTPDAPQVPNRFVISVKASLLEKAGKQGVSGPRPCCPPPPIFPGVRVMDLK